MVERVAAGRREGEAFTRLRRNELACRGGPRQAEDSRAQQGEYAPLVLSRTHLDAARPGTSSEALST